MDTDTNGLKQTETEPTEGIVVEPPQPTLADIPLDNLPKLKTAAMKMFCESEGLDATGDRSALLARLQAKKSGEDNEGQETVETTESQRGQIGTTEAKRSKKKSRNRQKQAELQKTLAMKKCPHCLTVGKWKITSTQGRVRYVKCLACGRTAQVATEK